jgi:hypothetical protein
MSAKISIPFIYREVAEGGDVWFTFFVWDGYFNAYLQMDGRAIRACLLYLS